jgi:hypothetical protein
MQGERKVKGDWLEVTGDSWMGAIRTWRTTPTRHQIRVAGFEDENDNGVSSRTCEHRQPE